MDKKHLEELKDGYTFDANGVIRDPGKFEGETLATLYFYDAYMNGDGVVFELDEDEKQELGIKSPFVYLAESNDGFISLIFCESEKQAEELDEMNSTDEYSGLDEGDF
jgi:hypothetical protein